MNLAMLFALLAVTLTDPTGDAIGDGTLDPPTSPIYANVAMFDLQAVELQVSEAGEAVLSVTLGALGTAAPEALDEEGLDEEAGEEPPADEAAAVPEEATEFDIASLLAVVDVYLDTGDGGADKTLSGPNMLLPAGAGWHHAVRVSAEGAWGVTYAGVGPVPEGADALPVVPQGPEGAAEPAPTEPAEAEPQTLTYVPLNVTRRGNVLSMTLPWSFDPEAAVDLYALSGLHDPFSPDGWRGISPTTSPWAFSGGEQVVPVIDILAADAEVQAAALRSGVLPSPQRASGMTLPLSPWLWLMVAGLALALFGLVLRGRVAAPEGAGAESGTDAEEATGCASAEEAEAADLGDNEEGGRSDDAATASGSDGPGEGGSHDGDALVDVLGTLLPFEDAAGHDGAVQPGAPEAEPAATGHAATAPGGGATDEEGVLVVEDEAEPVAGGRPAAQPEGLAQVETPRSAFSTVVEDSYLLDPDDAAEGLFGDDPESDESFWHPGSRGRSTLVEPAPAAEASTADGPDAPAATDSADAVDAAAPDRGEG